MVGAEAEGGGGGAEGFYHGGGSAGVEVGLGEVLVGLEDGLVDPASCALPGGGGFLVGGEVGEDGGVGEVGVVAGPLLGEVVEVEVLLVAGTPEEVDVVGGVAGEGLLD